MQYKNTSIKIIRGNIAEQQVDAVVNAVNKSLTGSGSGSGIFKVAGPELFKACIRLGECKIGESKITEGYNLPARFVIHTISPMFGQENGYEASYLEDCYKNSLALAETKHISSIAFASTPSGAYPYPIEEAAPITLESIKEYVQANPNTSMKEIIVSCNLEDHFNIFTEVMAEIFI